MKRFIASTAFLLAASGALAELVPVAPAGGEIVPMLTKEQLEISAVKTYKKRLELLKPEYLKLSPEDRTSPYESVGGKNGKWRAAPAFRLKWEATDGERGPWKIELADNPAFDKAEVYYAENVEMQKADGGKTGCPPSSGEGCRSPRGRTNPYKDYRRWVLRRKGRPT